jgi:hypothetical protein
MRNFHERICTITILQLCTILELQLYNYVQFYKYNFTSFARSNTEQMPALVVLVNRSKPLQAKVEVRTFLRFAFQLVKAEAGS